MKEEFEKARQETLTKMLIETRKNPLDLPEPWGNELQRMWDGE